MNAVAQKNSEKNALFMPSSSSNLGKFCFGLGKTCAWEKVNKTERIRNRHNFYGSCIDDLSELIATIDIFSLRRLHDQPYIGFSD